MADEKSVVKINEGFGKITKEKSAELAATAAASASRAEIESSYVMALKKPRNEDMARTKILDRCKNLRFALKAMYSKPVGSVKKTGKWVKNFIEGPSIRFAEEMLRLWGNVKTQQSVLYDDPYKRIIKIIVIDLESNSSYSKDVTIEKHVERKNCNDREVLGERINSRNEKVYIVVATEQELMNKESAEASKVIRNNGLRLIPEHIIEEGIEEIRKTTKAGIDKDPEAAKNQIIDAFATINVYSTDLEKYLGCPLKNISPAQIDNLRKLYTSINEGQTTWSQVVEGTNGKPELMAPQQKAKPGPLKPDPKKTSPRKNMLASDMCKHFIGEIEKSKTEADLDKLVEEINPETANFSKAEKDKLTAKMESTREAIQKKK